RASVPYDEMPELYARASCLVLASLPHAGCSLLTGPPRCFWEEQFGMVLAEAMAAGLPILASESGAIREVAGEGATYFPAGDWVTLAGLLEQGPLSNPPGTRVQHDRERVKLFSTTAAAERLAAAYDELLG
ncbi:MAG TPA: glycosyltransferase, partial [Thermoleophilaceae bacterium]|nr:glycosyltransferase [Thermoleophilaceae bacterium]